MPPRAKAKSKARAKVKAKAKATLKARSQPRKPRGFRLPSSILLPRSRSTAKKEAKWTLTKDI